MKSGVQAHCSYRWSLQPLLIPGIVFQASAHTFSKSKTLPLSTTVLWKEVCHRHHKFYSRKEFHVFLEIATEDLCSWIHTDTETHTSYEMQLILPLLITGLNNTWSTFRKFSPIILTFLNSLIQLTMKCNISSSSFGRHFGRAGREQTAIYNGGF